MSFKSNTIPADRNEQETSPIRQTDSVSISVRHLGKCYNIYKNPQDKLKEVLSFGRRTFHREFWALRHVSLDVKKGETVGIVGRNGSGKSTLLQIICGTLAPTTGSVRIQGRVAALLELGSGFNPEFTGRENVFMNAAVLGLSTEEIHERYQSILDFADIGDFVEQPVKTYSSGMQVRLAFAVAVNVDPDILVVDEALAVGDEIFRRKCFSRIHEMKERGATILFVSHSAGAVIELCDRAYLLDRGEAILNGVPKTVISKYHQLIYAPPAEQEGLRAEILMLNAANKPMKAAPKKQIRKPAVSEDPSGSAY
ncbi:MAG: ABC transporter ATP-binding protein, partial [Deltaproteobacteria bacterium]|nr:ABC transporter ATP-binding protein [Deltaproteobacteria bacterium]